MHNPLTYILLISIFLNQPTIPFATKNQDAPNNHTYQAFFPVISTGRCNCFYIDSNNGSDSNSGTQPSQPWKTFRNLNTDNLLPGTNVYLRRGSIWTVPLHIHASGQAGMPITITAYGSGAAPILSNPGNIENNESAISLVGSYIIIDNVFVQESGTGIDIFSDHNIVQNSEIKNTGIGIAIEGQYNLITHNYIHDLRMIANTPGGDGDDWGALGVDILNAHNEVSFNRFENCEAPSYDYGMAGAPVEIYQMGDYTSFHHNLSIQTGQFMEISSRDGTGSAKNVTISFNVIINATRFTVIHISDNAAVQIQDFRVENNTLIDLRAHNPIIGRYIVFLGTPSPDSYILRNNIIYISDFYRVSSEQITHENNLYYLPNPSTQLGDSLGAGEMKASPQFIDLANYNFRLLSTSPAINAGINMGYTEDFDQNPVPIDNVPDLGAFEYQGN
jgi:hypothetical protein